jgi:hypothetical protein
MVCRFVALNMPYKDPRNAVFKLLAAKHQRGDGKAMDCRRLFFEGVLKKNGNSFQKNGFFGILFCKCPLLYVTLPLKTC